MKNAIVLCSGGLDSVVTTHYAKKKKGYDKIKILFFDYGQRSLNAERTSSKRCASELDAEFIEIKLDFNISTSLINIKKKVNKINRKDLKNSKKESEKFYVSFRNGIFLSYAIALADSLFTKNKEVWDILVGFKSEGREAYPDATADFVKVVNDFGRFSKFKGQVIAPLIKMDKDEIVKLGVELGISLGNSHSCYVSDNEHCGVCLACRLRQEAFYWANIKDETKYKEKMIDYRKAENEN